MGAPTLIVGLGGTGCDIVKEIHRIVKEDYEGTNISFVAFDTDANELRELEKSITSIRTIQISKKLTVGQYLDKDHFSRDTWFPVHRMLNSKTMTDGAGQVRSVSRLALNAAIKAGNMAPLEEAIKDLFTLTGDRIEQAPRIIVTGSLCGGTGSGLILPICLYIRNYMANKMSIKACNIRAFLLLPEVFDFVIKQQSERNNLRANAYAAVREINAFILKDAGSLSEKFNPRFFVPRAGSRRVDELTGSPMDYCFLYDTDNLNGLKLTSFSEYKKHAANCICGMAIAPTSIKSNSTEDNIIREMIESRGRKRFAGAGSSTLKYPQEDVEKYLALNWTKASISKEWLQIDERFREEELNVRKQREKGLSVEDIDRGEHYIRVVNELMNEDDIFAKTIHSLCMVPNSDVLEEHMTSWDSYISALTEYIDNSVEKEKDKFSDAIEDIESMMGNISNPKKVDIEENKQPKDAGGDDEENETTQQYHALFNKLNAYFKLVRDHTKNFASNLSYQLFDNSKDYSKDTNNKHRVEYWLHRQNKNKEFMHPNAVRYFLYNLIIALEENRKTRFDNYEDIFSEIKDFSDVTFGEKKDIQSFINEKHMEESLLVQLVKLHYMTAKKGKATLEESFQSLSEAIDEYWNESVKLSIYEAAIKYFKDLSKNYERLYDQLGKFIPVIDDRMSHLEEKYPMDGSHPIRYICASKECLEGMAKETPYSSSMLSFPSEINREIYVSMKEFTVSSKTVQSEEDYRQVFESKVIEHFKTIIKAQYKDLVEMDIISAISKEAEYIGGLTSDSKGRAEKIETYSAKVIDQAINLATPFIQGPDGEEPRIITTCAYSKDIRTDSIPGRINFVNKYLSGIETGDIKKNVITFYRAVYNLAPADLPKFLCAKPSLTNTDAVSGDYYRAYYELVSKLNPVSTVSNVITPHIDRMWHIPTRLPDLDDYSQEAQEKEVFAAFFWGIVGDYIRYKPSIGNHFVYYANTTALGLQAKDHIDELIVSNNTPCDCLYEVLDSFNIYPRLVKLVRKAVNNRINADLNGKKSVRNSVLYQRMDSFKIKEKILESGEHDDLVRSIFDIPMLMKWSVPTEEYHAESMEGLLETILVEVKAYLRHFCDEKEFVEVYAELLEDQMERFINNMKVVDESNDLKVFNDELFEEIVDIVIKDATDTDLPLTVDKLVELKESVYTL